MAFHRNKILLISSLATAALALLAISPNAVKADEINSNQVTTNKVDANATANSKNSSDVVNQSNVSKDGKENKANSNSKNSANPVSDNDKTAKQFTSTKATRSDTVENGTWRSIRISYDTVTHTLNLGGGHIKNKPIPLPGFSNALSFDYIDWDDSSYVFNNRTVETVNFTGKLSVEGSASFLFNNFVKLKSVNGIENLDLKDVTDMSGMFYNCPSLEKLDLSKLFVPGETYKVTDMSNMFNYCINLKELNLSNFKTDTVTNMASMFNACESLTDIDLSGFNTANVTDMSNMFYNCFAAKELNLANFNTANVTNMLGMFSNCYNLTSIKGLEKFNTAKVNKMEGMFFHCEALPTLNLSNFDTSNVNSIYQMFDGCKSLQNLDISSFDMTKATNKTYMLRGLSNLQTLVLGKKCVMANTGLDTPGTWMNMGDRSQKARFKKGKFNWTSQELMSNYNGNINYDAYTIVK